MQERRHKREREIGKEVEGKKRVEGEVELERERALLLRGWVADIRVPSPTGKCS